MYCRFQMKQDSRHISLNAAFSCPRMNDDDDDGELLQKIQLQCSSWCVLRDLWLCSWDSLVRQTSPVAIFGVRGFGRTS